MQKPTIYCRNFLLLLQARAGYDQQVLLKEPAHKQPIRSHLDQLYNEYTITKQLTKVTGVRPAFAMEGTESQPVLLLEYIPGQSLAELISTSSLNMTEKLLLAVNLATVLNRIHDQQIMHKDISSDNILVTDSDMPGSQDGVYIIDFGLASTMKSESPNQLEVDDTLVGTLAYISPEQTGRMNRQVDYRTDLYSLGVTLYELFTGQLPFETGEPLEMIHAHIARQPRPPQDIDNDIPVPVSDIILKLMAKNTEERYQSALGLQHDLEDCARQLLETGMVETFVLGESDFAGVFSIPQELYGRDNEVKLLLDSFDRISSGEKSLLMVTGFSGVGKSALVHEIHIPITVKRGFFIEGKFDQYQRNIPYSAWGQAFSSLVNQLLMENETRLHAIKSQILEAIGTSGKVFTDIIPNLELVIGPQQEVTKLGGQEAQDRFNYLFQNFIKAVARPEHPLVIFLDDLQWIDSASLGLLKILLTNPDQNYFLIIGAYRDNEVEVTHPLMTAVAELEEKAVGLDRITLQNLTESDINDLVADSLHCSLLESGPLARLIYTKTAGNAFFTHQLLQTLDKENLLAFDAPARRWKWNMATLDAMDIADNVVELLVTKVKTFPLDTQAILKQAACIGNQFDLGTLAIIAQTSEEAVRSSLQAALLEEAVFVLKNGYKFAHDRVQQTAYSLISEVDKKAAHLEIGRLLLQNIPEQEREESIFDIVNQLNIGAKLLNTQVEKTDLAKLNLLAGEKAKASIAYRSSIQYLRMGIELLAENHWQVNYDLSFNLYLERAETEFLSSNFSIAETLSDELFEQATSDEYKLRVYHLQLEIYGTQARYHKALDIGLEALSLLGVTLLPLDEITADSFQPEMDKFKRLLGDKPIDTLFDLPKMEDKRAQKLLLLLSKLGDLSLAGHPDLFNLLTFIGVNLSLEYGNTSHSAFSYVLLGSIFTNQFQDFVTGHHLARMGISLIEEKYPDPQLITKGMAFFTWHINHWMAHPLTNIEFSQRGYLKGMECGNIAFASYGYTIPVYALFSAGAPLDEVIAEIDKSIKFCTAKKTALVLSLVNVKKMIALSLQGKTKRKLSFSYQDGDVSINEENFVNECKDIKMGLSTYYIGKIQSLYFLGAYTKALEYVPLAEKNLGSCGGHITKLEYHFYYSLTVLAVYPQLSEEEKNKYAQSLQVSMNFIKHCSEQCGAMFLTFHYLLEAEMARISGKLEAIDLYDQAIACAKENKFTQNVALGNELAARFWLTKSKEEFAQIYLKKAHYTYQQWGALAKVKDLETQYPQWLTEKPEIQKESAASTTGHATLDLNSVIKASQAMAGEIVLDRLLIQMMQIVIENAGAQKGFLILEQEGEWVIEAEGDIDSSEISVLQSLDIELNDSVSSGIINYVARTKGNVVLDNAANEGDFTGDESIQQSQAKSVLCTPLINQGKVSGILYLENNLVTGAFTSERVELLNLLSSQMAMALGNAQLYANLEESEKKYRDLVDNSLVGVFTTTLDGKFIFANDSIVQMYNFDNTEQMLAEGSLARWKEPKQREQLMIELKEKGSVSNFEVETITYTGRHIHVLFSIKLQKNNIIGMVMDITERKLAEEAILKYQQRLKNLAHELTITEEKQRRQIATDLHDHVGQILASSRLQMAALDKSMDKEDILKKIKNISGGLSDSIKATRDAIFELSPPQLNEIGLAAALSEWMNKELKTKHWIKYELTSTDKKYPINNEVRYLLFRCACELLVNVVKHARASQVGVIIQMKNDNIFISVNDNGSGFNYNPELHKMKDSGFGLLSINERIENISGTLQIETTPGKGAKVILKVPVNK